MKIFLLRRIFHFQRSPRWKSPERERVERERERERIVMEEQEQERRREASKFNAAGHPYLRDGQNIPHDTRYVQIC